MTAVKLAEDEGHRGRITLFLRRVHRLTGSAPYVVTLVRIAGQRGFDRIMVARKSAPPGRAPLARLLGGRAAVGGNFTFSGRPVADPRGDAPAGNVTFRAHQVDPPRKSNNFSG